jgi:hypothetical protein
VLAARGRVKTIHRHLKISNFKFTAKFPKLITHDKRLKDVDDELERFFDGMGPLENKTPALLIQMPPIQIHTGLERLQELVDKLDTWFRYAIEDNHLDFRILTTCPTLCHISYGYLFSNKLTFSQVYLIYPTLFIIFFQKQI